MSKLPLAVLAIVGLTASTMAYFPGVGSTDSASEVVTSDAEPGTVYLTFDDGPHPEHTQELLEIFAEHGQTTSFFAVGGNLENYPEIGEQILAEGHVLANHTYSHPDLTELDPDEREEEIVSTNEVLADLGSESNCVRPPFGSHNDEILEQIEDLGMQNIMWDMIIEDWEEPGVEYIADMLRTASAGDIVVLHDAGGDRSQTVEAVELVLPEMIEQGYEFEALPECF